MSRRVQIDLPSRPDPLDKIVGLGRSKDPDSDMDLLIVLDEPRDRFKGCRLVEDAIAANAVTTGKILNGSVTTAKILDAAVDSRAVQTSAALREEASSTLNPRRP